MAELLTPAEMERLAKARGLTVAQLCARAGVAHSTFTRWRAGKTEPTLDVYRRFKAAVDTVPEPRATEAAA